MTPEIKKDEESGKEQPKEKFSLKNTWNQKKDDVLVRSGRTKLIFCFIYIINHIFTIFSS